MCKIPDQSEYPTEVNTLLLGLLLNIEVAVAMPLLASVTQQLPDLSWSMKALNR